MESPVGGTTGLERINNLLQDEQDGNLNISNMDNDELSNSVSAESIMSQFHRQILKNVKEEVAATTWQAFWRTSIDGAPAKQVADELGLSVASVYQSKSEVCVGCECALLNLTR